jgi:DNA-binding NtrC family response regulator
MPVVLIVSNDKELATAVESAADSIRSCQTRWITDVVDLEANLLDESVCLAIVHLRADADKESWDAPIQHLCSLQPRIATLIIRDAFDGEQDLRCLRMGVRECVTRPLDLRRMTYLIDSLTMRSRLESARSAKPVVTDEQPYGAASPVMRQLLSRAQRIAARDVSILLNGETGVGKTHLARWIHQASPRASRPFVSINCGSLPANLIESELFGHKRGAFTGADEDRVGKFAFVQDGTLLLDEIDALPLTSQAKLLRVLDEGIFEQIGCNKSLPFRGRLIVASNRTLEELVEKDQFRADLYYRLNVVQFHIPALRNRTDEVRPLVRSFLNSLAKKHDVAVPLVDHEVWRVLETYHWPGNLRELRNTIEHAVAHCEGTKIGLEELPAKFSQNGAAAALSSPHPTSEPLPVANVKESRNGLAHARQVGEYRYLLGVLDMCDNNRSQAARALGISRTALYKKLGAFGIS